MNPDGGVRPAGSSLDDVPLRMSAWLPTDPIRITGPFLEIRTEVTNISGSPLNLLTARFGADIVVVSEGVVVRPPGFQRDAGRTLALAPGASFAYGSSVNLGYPSEPSGPIHPLAAGTYQLHAVQRFVPVLSDGYDPQHAFVVRGGPWDVHIG